MQEIRGQRLFQYLDDDGTPTRPFPVASLRESADADITAKDFGPGWRRCAAAAPRPARSSDSAGGKAVVKEVIEQVAADLEHTDGVPRRTSRVLETFGPACCTSLGDDSPRRAPHPLGRRTQRSSVAHSREKEALRRG
jgi:DNA topoisomerase IB